MPRRRLFAALTPSLFILAMVAAVCIAAVLDLGVRRLRQFVLDEESRQMIEQMNR